MTQAPLLRTAAADPLAAVPAGTRDVLVGALPGESIAVEAH